MSLLRHLAVAAAGASSRSLLGSRSRRPNPASSGRVKPICTHSTSTCTDWYSPRGKRRKDVANCRVTAAADWAKLRRHIHAAIPAPDSWRFLSPPPSPIPRFPSAPIPTATPPPGGDGRSSQALLCCRAAVSCVCCANTWRDSRRAEHSRPAGQKRKVSRSTRQPQHVVRRWSQSGPGSLPCCGRVKSGQRSSRANSRGQAEQPLFHHLTAP